MGDLHPSASDFVSNVSGNEFKSYENGKSLLKGKFLHLEAIQAGAFGKVTLALDVTTNCKVALKAMYRTKRTGKMAKQEVKVLQILGHNNPHICQLLEHFETEEFVVLVLEYCAKGDLYDLIHSSTSAPHATDILQIAKDMYSGITYSHSLGVYHRDLKPENILFTESGRVKICDWGLSSLSAHSTVFGVGTEKYMAPECFSYSPFASHPGFVPTSYDCEVADYWSFGVTLLTATFGKCPFKSMSANCDDTSKGFHVNPECVKKSLKWDTNFKNFVLYNRPEVLYDIYPDMNANCFNIFMNLLKVGSIEDGLESFNAKIQSRNLENFIEELEDNVSLGLTVWDEDDLLEIKWADHSTHTSPQESVFNMDDFSEEKIDNQYVQKENLLTSERREKWSSQDSLGAAGVNRFAEVVPSSGCSFPVPSLTKSSYQSTPWYDLEEDMDENEMTALLNTLSFRNAKPLDHDSTLPELEKNSMNAIRIVQKDVEFGGDRFSWSDY